MGVSRKIGMHILILIGSTNFSINTRACGDVLTKQQKKPER